MISPDDLLAEARMLLAPDATEARIRSAVSRAYYACFHHVARHPAGGKVVAAVDTANQDARTCGQPTRERHFALTKALVASGDKDLITIAADMARMLRRRADADYDLSETFRRRDAEYVVAMAHRLFKALPVSPLASSPDT